MLLIDPAGAVSDHCCSILFVLVVCIVPVGFQQWDEHFYSGQTACSVDLSRDGRPTAESPLELCRQPKQTILLNAVKLWHHAVQR